MSRPDLPPGFEGWQALDATPQEESPQGGGYRTGPAPLKAIKEGNSVPFDTNFIIAEVGTVALLVWLMLEQGLEYAESVFALRGVHLAVHFCIPMYLLFLCNLLSN